MNAPIQNQRSVRAYLRNRTSRLHERVDRLFPEQDIATLAGYSRFLQHHAKVVIPLEIKLAGPVLSLDIPHMESRWRSPALKRDLHELGAAMPPPVDVAFVDSPAYMAGLLYVLEGSRLGSEVILNRVVASAGEMPVKFLSHGCDARFWSSYVKWLDNRVWTDDEIELMVEGAEGVFHGYLCAGVARL